MKYTVRKSRLQKRDRANSFDNGNKDVDVDDEASVKDDLDLNLVPEAGKAKGLTVLLDAHTDKVPNTTLSCEYMNTYI